MIGQMLPPNIEVIQLSVVEASTAACRLAKLSPSVDDIFSCEVSAEDTAHKSQASHPSRRHLEFVMAAIMPIPRITHRTPHVG